MKLKTIALAVTVAAAAPLAAFAADAGYDNRSTTQKTGDYVSDSALTAKVKTALLTEKNLKSLPISVESTDGVVTLTGQVASSAQIDQAVDVTKHVKGVKDVHNTLELKTNMVRALTRDVPCVRAEGKVIQAGRQVGIAEGRIVGPDGTLYAHATTTCLIFDFPPRKS